MSILQQIEIAQALDALGVDSIEAGFPASSPDSVLAVQEIAKIVQRPIITAFARCTEKDIIAACTALQDAHRRRIHTFIATSDQHLEKKLFITRDEAIQKAVTNVTLAKAFTDDVQFSAEDATRSDLDFLAQIYGEAIRAGATTINSPDTLGICTPEIYGEIFKYIIEHVPEIRERNIVVSSHTHDDLGFAVANTMAAIQNGARQAEVTVNGIGERAGNARISATAMAMLVHEKQYGVRTRINHELLVPTSKIVAKATWPVQPNSPIDGQNAFATGAGIHEDGQLKDPLNYLFISPASVGWTGDEIVLGRNSGRKGVMSKIRALGMPVRPEDEEAIFERFKTVADAKVITDKYVSDAALLDEVYFRCIIEITGGNHVVSVYDQSQAYENKTVAIGLKDGTMITGVASSKAQGTVNAMQHALAQLMPNVDVDREGLHTHAIGTGGAAADAKAWITLKNEKHAATRSGDALATSDAELEAMQNAFNALSALDKYEAMIESEKK